MAEKEVVAHTDHVEHSKDFVDVREAAEASAAEHATTFWEALKQNKKAALWSALISMTIIMEGYDIGAVHRTSHVHICALESRPAAIIVLTRPQGSSTNSSPIPPSHKSSGHIQLNLAGKSVVHGKRVSQTAPMLVSCLEVSPMGTFRNASVCSR